MSDIEYLFIGMGIGLSMRLLVAVLEAMILMLEEKELS